MFSKLDLTKSKTQRAQRFIPGKMFLLGYFGGLRSNFKIKRQILENVLGWKSVF